MSSPAAPASPPVSPDRRYVLHERLGAGGMGEVWRAADRLTGHMVALKRVVTTRATMEPEQQAQLHLSLAREFRLLSSLRHPGVISVLDFGFDASREPYFTMELLDTPQTVLQAARGLDQPGRIELLLQLLQALAYLHRRGVLHRDLKPSNVLVQAGQVKVLDFGLSALRDRARGKVGTLPYMAPEVLRDQRVTEAADLYAVGVIAYEVLAGRHPFRCSDAKSLINQVLTSVPDLSPLVSSGGAPALDACEAPTDFGDEILDDTDPPAPTDMPPSTAHVDVFATLAEIDASASKASEEGSPRRANDAAGGALGPEPELPPGLAGIVGALLSKRPEHRIGSAAEVAGLLSEAAGLPAPQETVAIRESYLQAARFVGRDAEVERLGTALTEALAGRGSAWLVGGESGVGKTRLVAELLTQAVVDGALLLRGQARREGAGAYEAWRDPLRRLVLAVPPEDAELQALTAVDPHLAALLGRRVAGSVLAPTAERLHETIETLLRRLAQPLVVLLEDVHWADDDSLSLLARLAGAVGDRPVLLLATFRDDERPDLPARLPAASLLRLQRLSQPAIVELAASMLGPAGRRADVIAVVQRETEGNAFFVVEVVRALAEEAGSLQAVGASALPDVLFTGGVRDAVQRRLARVPAWAQPLLELAAVAGRVIEPDVLRGLAPDVDVERWIADCALCAVLELDEARWRFAHDKLREGLLRQMTAAGRRDAHRQIARVLLGQSSEPAPERVPQLAHHALEGELWPEAAEWQQRAGEAAQRLYAFGQARVHYAHALRALDHLPATDDVARHRIDVIVQSAVVSMFAVDPEVNLARLQEAEAAVRALPEAGVAGSADSRYLARVLHARGRCHYVASDTARAIGCWKEVLLLAQASGDEGLLALPLAVIGRAHIVHGDYAKGEPLLARAVPALDATGNLPEWLSTFSFLTITRAARGRCAQAIGDAPQVLARAREARNLTGIAVGHITICFVALITGRLAEAAEEAQQIAEVSERSGDRMYVYLGHAFRAWALGRLGQHEEAARAIERSKAVRHALGTRLLLSELMIAIEADVALRGGRPAEALALARESVDMARAIGSRLAEGLGERVAGLALGPSSLAAAEERLAASCATFEAGDAQVERARSEAAWGELLLGAGDAAGARIRLERAGTAFERAGLAEEAAAARALCPSS